MARPKKANRQSRMVNSGGRERTNILVFKDFKERLVRVHSVSGEKFIYQTLEKAISLLEEKLGIDDNPW